jgi:hypothetical protein
MGQFSFPQTNQAGLLIKLMDSQNGDSNESATVVSNNEVSGSVTSGNFCGETDNHGQRQQYTLYFDITFNHPFTSSKVITNSGQSKPAAVELNFDGTSTPVVDVKVGISYVSAANAKLNWQTENPGWDFTVTKSANQHWWDGLLSKISVSSASADRSRGPARPMWRGGPWPPAAGHPARRLASQHARRSASTWTVSVRGTPERSRSVRCGSRGSAPSRAASRSEATLTVSMSSTTERIPSAGVIVASRRLAAAPASPRPRAAGTIQ